jgi:membrane protein YqaA with SNARE-associated domain
MLLGVIVMALSGSVAFLIIGKHYVYKNLIDTIANSPRGLIVYTLGTGFPPIIRSLVTFLVESHHESKTSDIARLYALISVLEGIGSLLAGPGMAWAFQLGERWLGLPYGLAAMLFAIALVTVFTTKIN